MGRRGRRRGHKTKLGHYPTARTACSCCHALNLRNCPYHPTPSPVTATFPPALRLRFAWRVLIQTLILPANRTKRLPAMLRGRSKTLTSNLRATRPRNPLQSWHFDRCLGGTMQDKSGEVTAASKAKPARRASPACRSRGSALLKLACAGRFDLSAGSRSRIRAFHRRAAF